MNGLTLLVNSNNYDQVILWNIELFWNINSVTDDSINKPAQHFPKDFCMFKIVVLDIDSNTSSVSLSLIIVSAFKFEERSLYFAASSLSIFKTLKLLPSQV